MAQTTRTGSILIIVTGLAVLMLTSMLVISQQLKADTTDGSILMRDSQARIMLPAALDFILESARLGQHNGEECFGWTDVRDGGVGPRGPIAADGGLPPEVPAGRWPGPGGHYRADMTAWTRPPCAVRLTRAYNPMEAPRDWLEEYLAGEQPAGTRLHRILNPTEGEDDVVGLIPSNPDTNIKNAYWTTHSDWPVPTDRGLALHWDRVWGEITRPFDEFEARYHHGLQPQPVADDIGTFTSGDPRRRLESSGLGWFRVYRERPEEHDGDGMPWFDTVPMNGHGVFIITCGAGQSQGYRDWDEVVAAGATAAFMDDPEFFAEIRARERILWFRAEWSGFVGGGLDALQHFHVNLDPHLDRPRQPRDGRIAQPGDASRNGRAIAFTDIHTHRPVEQLPRTHSNSPIPLFNVLGSIRWIERLESEPTDAREPASGKPIW